MYIDASLKEQKDKEGTEVKKKNEIKIMKTETLRR